MGGGVNPHEAEQQDMTSKNPRLDGARIRDAIAVVEKQLKAMARELAEVNARLSRGDMDALSDAVRRTEEIRQWLRIALEMEMRLEKHGNDGRGSGAQPSIDLDEARSQIGCRLDRLRRARCSGPVPECPDRR